MTPDDHAQVKTMQQGVPGEHEDFLEACVSSHEQDLFYAGRAKGKQAGSQGKRRMASHPEDCSTSSASSTGSSKTCAEAASQSQRKRQRQPDSDDSAAERAEKRQKAAAARAVRALARAKAAGPRRRQLLSSSRGSQSTGKLQAVSKAAPSAAQRAAVKSPAWSPVTGGKSAARRRLAVKAQRPVQVKAGVQKPGGSGQRPRAEARGVLAQLSSIFMALRSQSRRMRHMRCQKRPT